MKKTAGHAGGWLIIGLLVILFSYGTADATSTYSGTTITVSDGTNTLSQVYTDISNPAVLSQSGNTYTVSANIVVNAGATLHIDNALLMFNEPAHNTYGLSNYGAVTITNSTLTSTTTNAWSIFNHNTSTLFMDTVDISRCGQGSTPGIKMGDYNVYGGTPIPLTWNNVKLHDNFDYYIVFAAYEPYWVTITNSEFYNLTSPYFPVLDLTYATVRSSKFHDSSGNLFIISWGEGGAIYDSEFYAIQTNSLFYAKEGSGGVIFQNNHIHDVTMGGLLGFYGSTWDKPTIYRDNIIENSTITELCYWRANQYLGGVSLISQFSNNTIRNVGTTKLAFHSGGQNCRIWGNKLYSTTLNFTADYQSGQAGGSTYHPGDSAGSSMRDTELGSIRLYDLDDPGDQSMRGKLFPFVNVKYASLTVDMPDDEFYDYKYLDVKVVDAGYNPIQGATVTVANIRDTTYPAINLDGAAKTSFLTGTDGHTPLPSDSANSIAILDFYKTSAAQVEMTYALAANYNGYTGSATASPDASWYRIDPNVYQNTVTILLPIKIESGAISGTMAVFPNPYIAGKYPGQNITFGWLPKEAEVYIYTVSGSLVKKFAHRSGIDNGAESWDVSGVASGVYIYSILYNGQKRTGKISVIK